MKKEEEKQYQVEHWDRVVYPYSDKITLKEAKQVKKSFESNDSRDVKIIKTTEKIEYID